MSKRLNIFENAEKKNRFCELQYKDYCKLQQLYEKFIFSLDKKQWVNIINELSNVIKKCDEIDYHDYNTAIAYSIWHFLDRYHRWQIILSYLAQKNCLNYYKKSGYNILDIGTGPSQVLFALSDYFSELNIIAGREDFVIKSEYVEQSDGFKHFLHLFMEFALVNKV